jgi:hypothetical protein
MKSPGLRSPGNERPLNIRRPRSVESISPDRRLSSSITLCDSSLASCSSGGGGNARLRPSRLIWSIRRRDSSTLASHSLRESTTCSESVAPWAKGPRSYNSLENSIAADAIGGPIRRQSEIPPVGEALSRSFVFTSRSWRPAQRTTLRNRAVGHKHASQR